MTRSSFVTGHFATHRTTLLSAVTLDSNDELIAGDQAAYDELRERGWLTSQGYGSYGTARGAINRASNRTDRRTVQSNRSHSMGGAYVPDVSGTMHGTGPTAHRAQINPTVRAAAPMMQNAIRRTVAGRRVATPNIDNNAIAPTFGVEIEFIGNAYHVAQFINDAGVTCQVEDYNHRARSYWKIVYDGSVEGGDLSRGGELVSPILSGDAGFVALRNVYAGLSAAGATFTTRTGLHVHHGASGLTRAQLISVAEEYGNATALIHSIMPQHRIGNGYCRDMDSYVLQRVRASTQWGDLDRYVACNLSAMAKHGTIEFRQHNGTAHYQSCANWIRLGQCLIASVVNGYAIDADHGLETWLRSLDCEERTVTYYMKRQRDIARREHRDTRNNAYVLAAAD